MKKIILKISWLHSALLVFLLMIMFCAHAAPSSLLANVTENDLLRQLTQAKQQLDLEQQRLTILQNARNNIAEEKTAQWQLILSRNITLEDVNNAELALADAQSNHNNIAIAIATTTTELNNTLQLQKDMSHEQVEFNIISSIEGVKQILRLRGLLKSIIATQQQRLNVLLNEQTLSAEQLLLMQRWYQQLDQLYHFHIQQNTETNVAFSSQSLQAQSQQLMQKLATLTQQLTNIVPTDINSKQQQGELQFQILITREKITINQITLMLLQQRSYFHPNIIMSFQNFTLLQLQQKFDQVNQDLQQLDIIAKLIQQKLEFIAKEKTTIAIGLSPSVRGNRIQTLNSLYVAYQAQLVIANDFRQEMTEYIQQLEKIRLNQLSVRQRLPGFSIVAWKNLLAKLFTVPLYMWHSLQDDFIELIFQLQAKSRFGVFAFAIAVAVLLVFWLFLRKSCFQWLQALEDSSKRFSRQVLAILLRLLRRNLGAILLLCALLIIKVTMQIDITLWISVVSTFLIYRVLTLLARIWLLESETDIDGKDVRLYHGLRWIFALGSVFSVIIIATHLFPVGYDVRVFCNKILMLLLFSLSLLLLRSWSVMPLLIKKVFAVRRTYVMRAIRLVCTVIPITLLTNALIGLIGYVQLAWVMAGYQVIALSTLTLYMIVRGLFIDFMDYLYHWLVAHYKSGWLWSQVFAQPFERIMRILLCIGAVFVFVYWSKLYQNTVFIRYWHESTQITLFNLFGNIITLPILIESIIIIALLYWFARWSREFAFRWLYAKAKDIGVRNSLSIFTQYAVVVLGVVIALRVLGFDLTGFAVVAAAFAAGIGLSLRDVATNFISGVMLLLERPFRTGDTITLGEYEGEVISTGMRSMTLRTWDRQELIVPNADMFTKPFINWTHQDSIVRSVVRLRINRTDDPHKIQILLLELFKEIPSVTLDPSPEVFMKELDEALIEFEIRYFVNLQIQDSRPRVRSEVLFAIWDCFHKHGIHSPETDLNIHILRQDEMLPNMQ